MFSSFLLRLFPVWPGSFPGTGGMEEFSFKCKYKPAGIRVNTRRERPNWTSPPENSRIIKSPHNRSLIAPTSLMIMWSIRLMRYTSFCNVWIEVHVASNRQGPLTCLARSYICSNRWRLVLQMMFDAWCVMHHISCNSYNTLFCTKVNGLFLKNLCKIKRSRPWWRRRMGQEEKNGKCVTGGYTCSCDTEKECEGQFWKYILTVC